MTVLRPNKRRGCKLCTHPRLSEIEYQLRNGRPAKDVAKEFKVRVSELQIHGMHAGLKHVGNKPILSELSRLVERADDILDRAINGGDFRSSSSLIRELRSTLISIGQNTGEIQHRTIRNVLDRHGLKNEAELDEIIENHRALESMTIEDYVRDGITLLKFAIEQRPELKQDIIRSLADAALPPPPVEPSGAVVVEEPVVPMLEA